EKSPVKVVSPKKKNLKAVLGVLSSVYKGQNTQGVLLTQRAMVHGLKDDGVVVRAVQSWRDANVWGQIMTLLGMDHDVNVGKTRRVFAPVTIAPVSQEQFDD